MTIKSYLWGQTKLGHISDLKYFDSNKQPQLVGFIGPETAFRGLSDVLFSPFFIKWERKGVAMQGRFQATESSSEHLPSYRSKLRSKLA